jgi:nucleotide-binding universal stress UspA family protein
MVKRILVPLDGSPLAEIALDAVALLAKRFEAEVILVRITPEPSFAALAQPHPPLSEAPAQAYLEQVAHWLCGEGGITRTAVRTLPPAQGIVSLATLEQVDLIVMTTHGRKGLDAFLHPSITWQVLAHTQAPILACTCMEGAEPCQLQVPRFMRDRAAPVLVALDGSLQAEQALPLAQEFAHTFGNPLLLARAVEPLYDVGMSFHPHLVDDVVQQALMDAHSYLQGKRQELMRAGFEGETVSGYGLAASLIMTWVQQYQAGLVALASHGRGWLGRVAVGSVARSILGQVQVPVLLLRRAPAQRGHRQGRALPPAHKRAKRSEEQTRETMPTGQ